MRVQAFCPELAFERFDETIVRRLSKLREVERDVIGIGLQVEIT